MPTKAIEQAKLEHINSLLEGFWCRKSTLTTGLQVMTIFMDTSTLHNGSLYLTYVLNGPTCFIQPLCKVITP